MAPQNPHPKDVEYPEDAPTRVRDAGETFDLVLRKGPISLDGLMDQIYSYSEDDVYSHLSWLFENEYITRRPGDLEEDGTTRDVYKVHPRRVTTGQDKED